ncbi:MAG: hypothetical protein JWM27_2050, partial [Gemmatimonadetes bacterium]|nr:hypothetical protein [Gemmatimonadota bacterium]
MARRGTRWTAALAALVSAAACGGERAGVQPLPPLQRPSPEARAGLPEVKGTWRLAGFEVSPRDTARIREVPELLAVPGDFTVATQRLDSLAGTYGREGAAYPFVGEARRDGVVSLVATDQDGAPQFAATRVIRDTMWLELTSFPSLQVWPVGTRAAFVRTPVAKVFRRFLGGAPIIDQDSVRRDSIRQDSVRRADSVATVVRDSAARAAAAAAPPPAGQPVPGQPVTPPPAGARPGAPAPVAGQPARPAVAAP